MYTIKDVAEMMEISEHTLRFWAKNDFFPFVKRDSHNVRIFTEEDLGWVRIVKCLRSVGTDNKSIKRYIDLCIKGDSTIPERYKIILDTKEKALQQRAEIDKQIDMLNYKVNFYQNLIDKNTIDPYNPINKQNIDNKKVAYCK